MKYINIVTIFFIGDHYLYTTFFNYSTYCAFINISSLLFEIFLFFFIIYNICFIYTIKVTKKQYYYNFIFFLITIIIINTFFYWYNDFFINFNLSYSNNDYIIVNKLISVFFFILILLISKNKLLSNSLNIELYDICTIYSFLLLFICLLHSSTDFFVLYLTIEGISFVLYTLGSLINKSLINIEAIIKYFLINNIASSFLLWSISYIYLFIGSTDYFEFQYYLMTYLEIILANYLHPICFILLVSFFFKLAIFPFHWWIADIYEGFWTPITLIYAVIIKLTFFLFLIKLIWNIFYTFLFIFQPFLLLCSLGSIIFGSLGAIIQTKIKRFLAYTSISQSGYILLGMSTNTLNGFIASYIYIIMYTFASLNFFAVLLNLEDINKQNNIQYMNQLYSIFFYNKEVSLHFLGIIFVMSSIPPFSSFFAKFFILVISFETKLEIISIFVLIISILGSYYYFNLIQQLIFFKITKSKIYIFNNNIYSLLLLRFNTIFFLITPVFIPKIYYYAFTILQSCFWPLSFPILHL